jgi:hypothetical protein
LPMRPTPKINTTMARMISSSTGPKRSMKLASRV